MPSGTEVLHVNSTGLNGSLPRDRPSKVLPFCTYVVHMDPVCPKCMPTKAANRKRTCPVHRSGPTRNTLSFADAYSMKMDTGVGVKCLLT